MASQCTHDPEQEKKKRKSKHTNWPPSQQQRLFFVCTAKATKQVVRTQQVMFLAAKSLINFLRELRCDLEKGKLNAYKSIPERTKKNCTQLIIKRERAGLSWRSPSFEVSLLEI